LPTQTPAELLTVREAADILRVSPETIRRRVRSGALPARKLGHSAIRIRRDDLDIITEPTTCPDSLEAHIARIVAAAPPLSPEQRDRLSMLFRPAAGATA
jgi:excisionase family DNA binding protein